MEYIESFVRHGLKLAEETSASAFVLLTENGESYRVIEKLKPDMNILVATPSAELYEEISEQTKRSVKLPFRSKNVLSTLEHALVMGLDRGYLNMENRVVALCSTPEQEAGYIFHYPVSEDTLDLSLYKFLRRVDINPEVFETVLEIAIEIGREGREGRLIGTAFVIGDEKEIGRLSKQIILNPFEGHGSREKLILLPEIKETVKEIAQLDGVFIINREGIIHSAGVYINVDTRSIEIPRGLGARHAAVAALTTFVDCLGITVSQSGGIVRVFKNGKVALTIEPHKRVFISRA